MKKKGPTIIWISLFAIAMGFLETAVVIYLRKLYYPSGFHFPLSVIAPDIALTEILREGATVIMLLAVGALAGKKGSQRFAYFIFAFAVWDLFYYLFLKLLIGWPDSLCTWDILFLIPVPWVGPVWAPCILSLTMLFLSSAILILSRKGFHTRILLREWLLMGSGSLLIIYAFCTDYVHCLLEESRINLNRGTEEGMKVLSDFVPVSFDWKLFGAGEAMLILAIIVYVMRVKGKEQICLCTRDGFRKTPTKQKNTL